jgi:hypothetical protein
MMKSWTMILKTNILNFLNIKLAGGDIHTNKVQPLHRKKHKMEGISVHNNCHDH